MATIEQTLATGKELETLSINTIRTLAMDGVQQANSGHPGAPMALAPVTYSLWQQFLRYDPEDPIWPNRDRFVLSNGHASMLIYAMLYLSQVRGVNPEGERLGDYAVSLDDIKKFRQLDSKTPGHPEYRWTAGIETTTGPLGQGVANSVGMAISGKWLGAHFNQSGFEIFNYNVYAVCGDGDMMEGVASEAASLAGHLKLSNLCWIYDENHVTLDGMADVSFTEDVGKRFEAYGWNVIHVTDANDLKMLADAYSGFLNTKDRPTLIRVNSHIGYGSPHKQDTSAAHGEPLGEEEVRLVKKFYGWPEDAKFLVPNGVLDNFKNGIGKRGGELRKKWEALFADYGKKYPDLAKQINAMQKRELPEGWDKDLPTFPADAKGLATRESSGNVLNAIAKNVPWLVGGSADLAGSDRTRLKFDGAGDFQADSYGGRNLPWPRL
jgi:transketolase